MSENHLKERTMRTATPTSAEGFSLVEVVIASGILAGALLSLAGIFTLGMAHMAGSSASLVAREKAREAVESVHTARDTGEAAWAKINNTSATPPGVFLVGPQPLKYAGVDGMVNTTDDGTVETQRSPGVDNIWNNADDALLPLVDYTREIQITPLTLPNTLVNPNLRQIRVIVRYKVGGMWRTYTLTTFVSSFS
jgi:Tfp pilus assembly protein PilV